MYNIFYLPFDTSLNNSHITLNYLDICLDYVLSLLSAVISNTNLTCQKSRG